MGFEKTYNLRMRSKILWLQLTKFCCRANFALRPKFAEDQGVRHTSMYRKLEHNMPEQEQHKYYNEHFEGVEIGLGFKNAVHVFQNCTFDNCCIRVNSNSSATPNILGTNAFTNCLIWLGRKMSVSTIEANFENCKFKGTWSGRIRGKVENCDFSEANLEMVAFIDQKDVGGNIINGQGLAIIENAGQHKSALKSALGEESKIWIHIRENTGLFVVNIKKHQDSEVLLRVFANLPFVKVVPNA